MKQSEQKAGAGEKAKSILMMILNCVILVVLIEFFAWRGLIGFLIFVLVLALWRLIKNRGQFMTVLRYLETMKWGKPLDRDLWKKGELKNNKKRIKAKFVWKKKDKEGVCMKKEDLEKKIKNTNRTKIIFLVLLVISLAHAAFTLRTISFIAAIICLISAWGCKILLAIYDLQKEVREIA